jgi:type VI secretion system secreted protein VgrG
MNHGEAHNENRDADIENQNRDDYVNTQLTEETEGVIRSIEARDELIDAGHDSASATNYPLQDEYHDAYNQAVTDARAANPNLTDAEAAEIGRAAGRQRVHDGFTNGEVQTSNTHEPYPDYYGGAWDGHHPTP